MAHALACVFDAKLGYLARTYVKFYHNYNFSFFKLYYLENDIVAASKIVVSPGDYWHKVWASILRTDALSCALQQFFELLEV